MSQLTRICRRFQNSLEVRIRFRHSKPSGFPGNSRPRERACNGTPDWAFRPEKYSLAIPKNRNETVLINRGEGVQYLPVDPTRWCALGEKLTRLVVIHQIGSLDCSVRAAFIAIKCISAGTGLDRWGFRSASIHVS
jgi:hypothetical protein